MTAALACYTSLSKVVRVAGTNSLLPSRADFDVPVF